jgi:hypothetical protein
LHSTGHFPYTGIYLNHHLNAEVGLTYKYKNFGAFISKNVDFVDGHSASNYATTGIYRTFKLTESLKVSPHVGYFLRQSYSLMDEPSDAWAAVVVALAITRRLTIENTILAGNLVRHHRNVSLANRLNATLLIGAFRIDAYTWYLHSPNGSFHFVSSSLAVTSPDWVITAAISARVQVAMLQQVTREKPENAMHRGFLISLIVPIDLSPKNRN